MPWAQRRRAGDYYRRCRQGFLRRCGYQGAGGRQHKIVDVNKGNYETFRAIHRNPKPVIVALHSFVLGGGIGMAGAADIILCSDCARFGVPEIDRGAMGGGAHLQRMFPVQKGALHVFHR